MWLEQYTLCAKERSPHQNECTRQQRPDLPATASAISTSSSCSSSQSARVPRVHAPMAFQIAARNGLQADVPHRSARAHQAATCASNRAPSLPPPCQNPRVSFLPRHRQATWRGSLVGSASSHLLPPPPWSRSFRKSTMCPQ